MTMTAPKATYELTPNGWYKTSKSILGEFTHPSSYVPREVRECAVNHGVCRVEYDLLNGARPIGRFPTLTDIDRGRSLYERRARDRAERDRRDAEIQRDRARRERDDARRSRDRARRERDRVQFARLTSTDDSDAFATGVLTAGAALAAGLGIAALFSDD